MLIRQRNRVFDIQPPETLKFIYIDGKGLGLFANTGFQKGEDVIRFKNTFVNSQKASTEAVHVTEDQLLDSGWLTPEAFINHGCSPTTKFDFRPDQNESAYVAIRDIKKDEEITFNYLTTEWDMSSTKFMCKCGAPNCFGEIKGFKYLTRIQQESLKLLLVPYLLNKLIWP